MQIPTKLHEKFLKLQAKIAKYPGASLTLRTGQKCRRCSPQGPEVNNLCVAECSYYLNHVGLHSWER